MCQPAKLDAPDVDDLALGDEQLHRLPDLVPGRVPVDVVHLVQVDVVGLQAAQAGLAGVADVPGREPRRVRPAVAPVEDLGGEHDLLPPLPALGEPATDDRLGLAAAVDVGRVEEVDALFERRVHDGEAVGLVGPRAEVHRAEAQRAHPQAGSPECSVLHDTLLWLNGRTPCGPTEADAGRPTHRRRPGGEAAPPPTRAVDQGAGSAGKTPIRRSRVTSPAGNTCSVVVASSSSLHQRWP